MLSQGKYKLIGNEKIITTTINDVWYTYGNNKKNLDFLSIDVEGFDFKILKSIDFDLLFPRIICVESVEFSEVEFGKKNIELIDYLKTAGFFHYADTYVNSIFVKNDFLSDIF